MNGLNKLMLATVGGLGSLWALRTLARRRRYLDLRGRTVLITGGSRGLGLVMARQFADEGANLAICARDSFELDRAQSQLEATGAAVVAVSCDMRRLDQVEMMIRSVEHHYGKIDVLVNNAGVIEVGPLESMTLRDFQDAMQTNFWGPVYATLAVLPAMRRRREGRIVNISSIGGKISVPHLLPYSASKFALTGFSEGLRSELADANVWVTTICPHLMRTGSPPNATFKGQHQAEYLWFSLSDSLPVVSMNAERAARRIIDACKHGDGEVILTLQANLAVRLHALFPEWSGDILALLNQLLPGPGGLGTGSALGKESYSSISPSWLTILGDRAGFRNNESP